MIISTKEGPHIEAKYVILATGYELVNVVPTTRHRVVSTYAIATPPLPGRLPSDLPLIWEASDPYLYLRLTRDNRVICGGEDEPFVDEEGATPCFQRRRSGSSPRPKHCFHSPDWRLHSPGPAHSALQTPDFRSSDRSPGIRGSTLPWATAATA